MDHRHPRESGGPGQATVCWALDSRFRGNDGNPNASNEDRGQHARGNSGGRRRHQEVVGAAEEASLTGTSPTGAWQS